MTELGDFNRAFDSIALQASPQQVAYQRAIRFNPLSPRMARACHGVLAVARVDFYPAGADRSAWCFGISSRDRGFWAAIIAAIDDDSVIPSDFVAWPIAFEGEPAPKIDFATQFGEAEKLGGWNAREPRLRVYRRPEAWLCEGGRGVCILWPEATARSLSDAPGVIEVDDSAHGREIAKRLEGYVPNPFKKIAVAAPPPPLSGQTQGGR